MKYRTLTESYKQIVIGEDGHEQSANVKNQLTGLKRNAEQLLAQVKPDSEYPSWWVNKLVKANDYLDTAKDFLQNKVDQGRVENKEEDTRDEIIERINFHSKSPAEKKGSDFDRKLEINGYKKILKAIEKINKDHEKFQYNNRADGPSNIFKGLQQVERTCYDMIREIEQGKWDGKVDLED